MSFSSAVDGIPSFHNFSDAERYFNNTKAVRSTFWPADERPLRKRSESTKVLVKHHNSYAARLHSTDMVTWHKDGTVSMTRYDSQSSVKFAERVSPSGLAACSHQSAMWLGYLSDQFNWRWVQPQHGKQLQFQYAGYSSRWTLLNPEDCVRHHSRSVNRARAKEVRQAIKPVMDWMQAVKAISGGDITELMAPVSASHWTLRHVYDENIRRVMDGDTNSDVFVQLAAAHAIRNYRTSGWWLSDSWKYQIVKRAYIVGDALDFVEIPLGVLPPQNRWK